MLSAMPWIKKEAYQKNLLGLCLNAFTILWQETLVCFYRTILPFMSSTYV